MAKKEKVVGPPVWPLVITLLFGVAVIISVVYYIQSLNQEVAPSYTTSTYIAPSASPTP